MENSGGALEGKKGKTKGRGRLAFFYGDALVDNTGGHNEMPPPEAVRLAYKEVKKGLLCRIELLPVGQQRAAFHKSLWVGVICCFVRTDYTPSKLPYITVRVMATNHRRTFFPRIVFMWPAEIAGGDE